MHDCPRFKQPGGENAEFWKTKLARNVERDREVARQIETLGWRQLVVWECVLMGKGRLDLQTIVGRIEAWLSSDARTGALPGEFE